jgi:O-methyltransferase
MVWLSAEPQICLIVVNVNVPAVDRFTSRIYRWIGIPLSVWFIFRSRRIHPAYRMGLVRRTWLGIRIYLNTHSIPSATSYKAHLAMALKILETPPETPGDIVECGTWKGCTAANLSLVCEIVGRRLKVFDSFQGLPEGVEGDRQAHGYRPGDYLGTIQEVRANLGRYGSIDVCELVEGWFEDTLPTLNEPVLLAYVDVDLEASLDTCVRHLWPLLVEEGYIFIDEYLSLDYCALFFSERWWAENFDRAPPGLIGSGTGLPLGDYYVGPWEERDDRPTQHPSGGAYTCKRFSGHWAFYPRDQAGV